MQQQTMYIEDPMMTQQMGSIPPQYLQSHAMIAPNENPNLIEWQLELNSILQDIEHMLRGDKIILDGKTNSVIWVKPKTEEEQLFNDKGINDIIRMMQMYLNRNTILSNYDEETIRDKVYRMASELNDMIFMRYEVYGLDTNEKRKLYPSVVNSIKDMVHSSYLRALGGKERESIHESRTVNQSIGGQYPGYMMPPAQTERRSLFNPMSWFKGK